MAFQIPTRLPMDGVDPKNAAIHNDLYDKLQQIASAMPEAPTAAKSSASPCNCGSNYIVASPTAPVGEGWVKCEGQKIRIGKTIISVPNLTDGEISIDGGSPVPVYWYIKT